MEDNPFSNETAVIHDDLRNKDRMPSLKQVCLLYSASVIILIFLAFRAQRIEMYSGLLITEFILILPMPLVMLYYFKYDMKKALRFNKISILNVFLIFCLMFFALWIVNILNSWYLLLIKVMFGHVYATSIPVAPDAIKLLINIFVIGVSAGICEEVLFRGTIMRGFERFGPYKAIIVTALLFGMWHMYFTSFFGTFVLGILIGFIVYRTNSIFGGMFGHFTHNTLGVVIPYIILQISKMVNPRFVDLGNENVDSTMNKILHFPKQQLIGYFVGQGFIMLFAGAIFAGLMVAFIIITKNKQEKVVKERISVHKKSLLYLLPGLAFIGFSYYAFGLVLLNIKIPLVIDISRIIGLI